MSIERLLSLVPPPAEPVDAGTPALWPAVEQALGSELPADYKRLVNLYGVGFFANWIYVRSPFTSRVIMRLGEPKLIEAIVSGREDSPQYHHPFPAYPQPGGLLPWGGDDNAGVFCWRTGGDPESWPTVNLDNHYSDRFREISASVTGLLSGWFAGEITGDWYPEDVRPTHERNFTAGYMAAY